MQEGKKVQGSKNCPVHKVFFDTLCQEIFTDCMFLI